MNNLENRKVGAEKWVEALVNRGELTKREGKVLSSLVYDYEEEEGLFDSDYENITLFGKSGEGICEISCNPYYNYLDLMSLEIDLEEEVM